MAVVQPPEKLIRAVGQAPGLGGARRGAMRATRISHRTPAPVVPIREELPYLLNARGLVGCGVEVGVKQGQYSELLLSRWRGRHLISVDPWAEAPAEDYVDVANVTQAQHDAFHQETLGRLQKFGDRSTVWRMFGGEAAEKVPHHSLDFVYLDARHDGPSVTEDLETWTPKVRPGGVIAGHDYVDGMFAEGEFGVRSSVDAFFAALEWPVRATFADPPWFSWWVAVPR
jgi:Methyltransferase domain